MTGSSSCDRSSGSSDDSHLRKDKKRRKQHLKHKKSSHKREKKKKSRRKRSLSTSSSSTSSTPCNQNYWDRFIIPKGNENHTKISDQKDMFLPPTPPNVKEIKLESNNIIPQVMDLMFQAIDAESTSSDSAVLFARELDNMIQLILNGECICLDGISSESVKMMLGKLFKIMGLALVEMDMDLDQMHLESRPIFGYAIPDDTETSSSDEIQNIRFNLNMSSICCKKKYLHKQDHLNASRTNDDHPTADIVPNKRRLGPIRPDDETIVITQPETLHEQDIEAEDTMIGPALPWTEEGKRRINQKSHHLSQPTQSPETLKKQSTGVNQREEWMTECKDHSFLNDVVGSLTSRTFKNEKSSRSTTTVHKVSEQVDPVIQQQLSMIKHTYSSSRGPSLMEMHQENKKRKASQTTSASGEWKWNRESDLEKGRKVDKEYLKMCMGGASKDLKNKFQGDFSKSFT